MIVDQSERGEGMMTSFGFVTRLNNTITLVRALLEDRRIKFLFDSLFK